MRLWVEHTNVAIAKRRNIDYYLNPRSSVAFAGMQEVKPGVMEYTFESRSPKLYISAGAKCRFIVSVDKNTNEMIGWRYNGNPAYCTENQ
jgi:hypothetical protein